MTVKFGVPHPNRCSHGSKTNTPVRLEGVPKANNPGALTGVPPGPGRLLAPAQAPVRTFAPNDRLDNLLVAANVLGS